MTDDHDQRVTLWRFEMIAPLLAVPAGRGRLKTALEHLASMPHEHPFKGAVRVGAGTLEEWLYFYKHQGLEGLRPVPRRDRGSSRRLDDRLAERIEQLAATRPHLDGRGILDELKLACPDRHKLPSLSTLYRFLRARGLDQRRHLPREDHRAFAFELAGDCWQADLMYGPALPAPDGRRQKTYLLAILDDATRLIAHAEFYFEQHLRSFKDCLKQALWKRGVPRRLYLDNGRIFRSRSILLMAARLGIHLLHTRPYKPQGRGKIERWFGTVRRSFLARLDLDRIEDLAALNRLLFAWVEGDYHQKPHRALDGEAPLDRWMRLSEGIRSLPRDLDLDEVFLEQACRRVTKDGTFTLRGAVFEAGPALIGAQVTVHFDPFDLRRVLVEPPRGPRLEAFPVDLAGNRRLRRNPLPEEPKHPPAPLRALEELARKVADRRPHPPEDPDDQDDPKA